MDPLPPALSQTHSSNASQEESPLTYIDTLSSEKHKWLKQQEDLLPEVPRCSGSKDPGVYNLMGCSQHVVQPSHQVTCFRRQRDTHVQRQKTYFIFFSLIIS